jgi:hypothetical protein
MKSFYDNSIRHEMREILSPHVLFSSTTFESISPLAHIGWQRIGWMVLQDKTITIDEVT